MKGTMMGDQQYDGKSAFDGLDVAKAKEIAEEMRSAEPSMEGGYSAKRFRVAGFDTVFEEVPATDVAADLVLDRDADDQWAPIVSSATARQIASLPPFDGNGLEYHAGTIYGDVQGAIAVFHLVDTTGASAFFVVEGDRVPQFVLPFSIFEVVESD